MKLALLVMVVFALVGGTLAFAGRAGHGPEAVEWGRVQWLREYDAAARTAKDTGKPIFLLFQEVPG